MSATVSRPPGFRVAAATWLAPLFVGALAFVTPAPAAAEVQVVATVPALAAIAREIGGNFVVAKSLTRPNQDPHFVDARPNLALDVNRADLLLVVGLELEVGWLPTLITGARNPRVQSGGRGYLDCSQFVSLLEVARQPVDRSQGDIHPGGNPHYLSDPRAAAAVAKGIAGRLAQIDPPHRSAYEANLAAFAARLKTAQTRWEQRLAPYRGTPVIAYHRTWAYVTDWIGIQPIEYLEPKPGIPPNPSHVARLMGLARQQRVQVILQEDYYPDKTAKLVADKIPAALVRVPGGPDLTKGQSYIDYIQLMVTALEQGFVSARSKR